MGSKEPTSSKIESHALGRRRNRALPGECGIPLGSSGFLGIQVASCVMVESLWALWNPWDLDGVCYCLTVVPRGLEPRTLRLFAVRSDQLSYETSV